MGHRISIALLLVLILAVILFAAGVLPAVRVRSDFNGAIFHNNGSSHGGITVAVQFQNNCDEGIAKIYRFRYKKTDEGKEEIEKLKTYEIKPQETLTITFRIGDNEGIWLEGNGPHNLCSEYTLLFPE